VNGPHVALGIKQRPYVSHNLHTDGFLDIYRVEFRLLELLGLSLGNCGFRKF
jgi:hypothetical protein